MLNSKQIPEIKVAFGVCKRQDLDASCLATLNGHTQRLHPSTVLLFINIRFANHSQLNYPQEHDPQKKKKNTPKKNRSEKKYPVCFPFSPRFTVLLSSSCNAHLASLIIP